MESGEIPTRRIISRRRFIELAAGGAAALGLGTALSGCSSAPPPTPTAVPTKASAPAAAPPTPQAQGAAPVATAAVKDPTQDPRVQAALKEGALSLYTNQFATPESRKEFTDAFRKRYGLPESFKVGFTFKNAAGVQGIVEEELKADKLQGDITTLPALPWMMDLCKAGHIMSYESPEYKAYTTAEELDINNRPYFVSDFSGQIIGWNTKVLPNLKIESWADILKPELKGKISMGNCGQSPSSATQYIAVRQVMGPNYFSDVAKQNVKISDLSEQRAEWVVSGEVPICIQLSTGDIYGMLVKGFDFINYCVPKEGTLIQPMLTAIMAKAPHPNAAQLWIDFFRSVEGSEMFARLEGRTPGRPDAKVPKGVPSATELRGIKMNLKQVDNNAIKQGQDEFKKMFGL